MLPELMICAMMISQADAIMLSDPVDPVAIEETEETEEEIMDTIIDEGVYPGTPDNRYVEGVEMSCGHGKALDCADDQGDYYECEECGWIEYYYLIPEEHEHEYELVYDGDGVYSHICMICGYGYVYEPSELELDVYWSQYDEPEQDED